MMVKHQVKMSYFKYFKPSVQFYARFSKLFCYLKKKRFILTDTYYHVAKKKCQVMRKCLNCVYFLLYADAKFWVGRGHRPSPQGLRIPDENGKESPLRRYDRKTIVLTLPDDLTIFDIGHFGVWCEAFTVDFGHVRIPEGLNVPPSLKMLGISPQVKKHVHA